MCWGNNVAGQLGEGSVASGAHQQEPFAVVATQLSGFNPIAVTGVDSSTCIIDGGGFGSVYCWGSNALGELGNGTETDSATPVFVQQSVSGTTAILAGEGRVCARSGGSSIDCWGAGPIGDGTNNAANSTPKNIQLAASCP